MNLQRVKGIMDNNNDKRMGVEREKERKDCMERKKKSKKKRGLEK